MVPVMFSRKYLILALSLTLAISSLTPADAKATRRRSGGGAPGGGVFLQTPNPTTPVEHNNRGVELGGKGIWADAIREHELAVEQDPYDSRWRTNLSAAHLEHGKHLAGKGRSDLAAASFRRAMFVDPANAAADAELDKLLARLKKNPNDYNYRRSLAEDADVSGQYDTSIVEWRKCIKMTNDPLSHANLGRVLLKAGKPVDGFKELRNSVGMSDWRTEQRNELATCHRQLGDILKDYAIKAKEQGNGTKGMKRLANAAIEYRRAVQLNPSDASATQGLIEVAQMAVSIRPSFDNHLMLGGAYLLGGKFPNAQQEYKECFKLAPQDSRLGPARTAYHQAVARSPISSPEQVADSAATIKKQIDADPENAQLWYILGRLREHQVEYEKAKKCYEKAVAINPLIDPDLKAGLQRLGAPVAVAAVPGTAASNKSAEQSKEALKKAMQEKEYTDLEGMIQGGQLDEAIAKAQDLFGKDPKDGRVAGIIGLAYEKKGDPDMAKGYYRTAAALGDSNSSRFVKQIDSNRLLPKIQEGEKLKQEGKWLEAASVFRDALIINAERADVHRQLAECLSKIGDSKAAKEENDEADRIDRGGEAPKNKSISENNTGESAAESAKMESVKDKKNKSKGPDKKVEQKTAEVEEGMSAAGMSMTTAKPKGK